MFDRSVLSFAREIRAAEDFRDKFLESWERMVSSYHGPHYMESADPNSAPENRYFEVVQMLLARLVHDNPSVRVKSRRPTSGHMKLAEAMQHGLNRWTRDYNLKYALESIAYDYLFSWGVGMVRTEDRQGTQGWNMNAPNEDASWPVLDHLSPNRYFHDPHATRWSEIRFQGHIWYDDYDRLVELADEDETWNLDEIERLAKDAGIDKLGRDTQDSANRGEIVGYEVWVPEDELDEFPNGDPEPKGGWRKNGYNGVIYTVAYAQTNSRAARQGEEEKARFIRDPRPYFGPRHGPYVVFGAYMVPGKTYPLGLFTAIEEELRDLNNTALIQKKRNAAHKRMVAMPQSAASEAKKIQSTSDDHVILLPVGDNGQMVKPHMIEVGGTTNEDHIGLQYKGSRVDRLLGISQAHQGNTTSSETATAVAVADQALNARLALLSRNFERGVVEVYERAGEAMYRDQDIVFPLGGDAAEQMGLAPQPVVGALGVPITDEMGQPVMREPDPWFQGGNPDKLDPESGADWAAMEFELEPYSMGYVDQAAQQRQVVELIQVLGGLVPLLREFQELDGQQVLKIVAAAWNNPAIANLIDPNVSQQTMGRPVGMPPEQPRMRQDAGRVGLRGGGNAGPQMIAGTVGSMAGASTGQGARRQRSMQGVG